MIKPTIVFAILLSLVCANAQNESLPADLRQHALTQYNASLFNPTFSLNRNNPQSVSFWTRWQWQQIDVDPTTLFLNYTRNLGEASAAGVGFFQHNTGIYFNTGGALNYAYQIEFNRLIKLSVGANVFGFIQQLADTRFPVNPIPGIPQSAPTDDFILQVAPGINLNVENFSMSLASENLFDYNFTEKESNTANSDKIFMGMASYDFPVMASDSTAYVRPAIYLRTIPEQQNQIGMNALFSTQKYWAQAGYNNFYGISVGAGGTVLNRFSLGALVEFGTSGSVNSTDPSFEIVASYFLGKPENRRKSVASGIDDTNEVVILDQNELTMQELREQLKKAQEAQANKEEQEVNENPNEERSEELVGNQIDVEEQKRITAEQKAAERQKRKEEVAEAKEAKRKENEKQKADRLAQIEKERDDKLNEQIARIEKQRKLDSAVNAKKMEAIEKAAAIREQQQAAILKEKQLADQRMQDSLDQIVQAAKELEQKEAVAPLPGEKYQEVVNEDGLEPGFYLIANVFGTKKYFDAFMLDLTKKGIQGKSFFRSANNYNYAYLERYDTIDQARKARDSKFNGKYAGKTWIFRAVKK